MNQSLIVEASDPLLLPFLEATDHAHAQRLLAELIQEQADPIIALIIKSKLRVSVNGSRGDQLNQDALDIASELRSTLIADLRSLQHRPEEKRINSFPDYVAVKTYSACADYFREKNPQRWRLKNRLRYQLKRNSRFALWKAEDNRWYAGFSEWASFAGAKVPTDTSIPPAKPVDKERSSTELLTAIFERAERPVEFDTVVSLAAAEWNITDAPHQSLETTEDASAIESVSREPGVDLLFEQRLYLERLWSELCELPVLQRAALLLNLRDANGGSAIFFIPHLAIASQNELAQVLEMPPEKFGALWNKLPLGDAEIAEILGVNRQQVINLRKTARERLLRRMEKTEREPRDKNKPGKKLA
jgi:hypothetical protein